METIFIPNHVLQYFVADYLLSNNHINSIIVHKFDFSDEEVSFAPDELAFIPDISIAPLQVHYYS